MSRRDMPICHWCKHFEKTAICHAFPDGIPNEIYTRSSDDSVKFDHRYPHPEDNGIQFELEKNFERIKNNPAVYLVMGIYNDIDKVYESLEKRFLNYDERHQAGLMQPQI